MDLGLLLYFAESGKPFVMEVTARTAADRKGGHLAVRSKDGAFVLRESAQCPEEDVESFMDTARHSYFNTNNLWFRLDRLKEALDENGGIFPLPIIVNEKHVNPRDKTSALVIQLETAMGAAIEYFPDAGAIEVPRSRFAPVKSTDDLLALRSDAFEITGDFRLQLRAVREGVPPVVRLDERHYRNLDQLEESLRGGVPSLVDCRRLTVRGPVRFSSRTRLKGEVVVENDSNEFKELPSGTIEDTTVVL
jgi:UDP-N-acetylglucosamine pyrophosphorylase